MLANNIVLSDIRALGLGPGDVLVVHTTHKLKPEARKQLEADLTKSLAGKNTFVILHGKFDIAKLKGS